MKGKGDKRKPAKSAKEFEIRFELAYGTKDKTEQDLKAYLQSAPREQPKWQ